MKKTITILLLVALTFSCADVKKNKIVSDSKTSQTKNGTYLKATIDGTPFYSETPSYFAAQKIITLSALSKDKNEKIRIYINYNKGPATYTFGKGISNSDNMVYTKNKIDWLAAKTKGEGTITLTEEGDYLLGKFSFTGVNNDKSIMKIADGEFKVKN